MTEAPVPRASLRRLWLALLGVATFIAVALVQAAVRPGFDVWHQAVSALSLGPLGWVQDLNFIFLGLVLLSTVPVWRQILRGDRGAAAYPTLTALAGVSFIALAFLAQDPAPGYDPEQLALTAPSAMGLNHLAVAGVAAAASVAALFVMASRLAGDPAWPAWAAYTRAVALLTTVCIVVYAIWSTRASGFAGTFERLAIIFPTVWAFKFLRRLRAGAPLVKLVAAADGAPPSARTHLSLRPTPLAMPVRIIPFSRAEWLAGIAGGICVTSGIALILATLQGPRFIRGSEPVWAGETRRPLESLVYAVTGVPFSSSTAARPAARSAPQSRTRQTVGPPAAPPLAIAYPDTAALAAPTSILSDTGNPFPPRVAFPLAGPALTQPREIRETAVAEEREAAEVAIQTLRNRVAAGLLDPPPLTQDERDAKLRAVALDAIGARSAGIPVAPPTLTGVTIGLPLGGPSRRQRERDRAIHAKTVELLARVQRRADSVLAERRRRTDSLAAAGDSLRERIGPPA